MTIAAARIVRPLAVLAVALTVLGVAASLTGRPIHLNEWFIDFLKLKSDSNLPNWFSSSLLLSCALLLTTITSATRSLGLRRIRRWAGLAGIFYYLSLDEAAGIHERLRTLAGADSWHEALAWALIGFGAPLLVFAAYRRFLLDLPPRTRALTFLSGSVYVTGAVVLELVSRLVRAWLGTEPFLVAYGISELAEMFGAILFAYTLLDYLNSTLGFTILLQTSGSSGDATTRVPGEDRSD